MTSIYAQVLGRDFARLHPQIQRRFGFSSADRHRRRSAAASWSELWHGPLLHAAVPLPWLLAPDHVPRAGPRRAVHDRELRLPRSARARDGDVDSNLRDAPPPPLRRLHDPQQRSRPHRRLPRHAPAPGGRHRLVGRRTRRTPLAVRGATLLRGPIAFTFPMLFSGVADVCEWYDDATSASTSRSTSTTGPGVRSSATEAGSRSNGAPVTQAFHPPTSFQGVPNRGSKQALGSRL